MDEKTGEEGRKGGSVREKERERVHVCECVKERETSKTTPLPLLSPPLPSQAAGSDGGV